MTSAQAWWWLALPLLLLPIWWHRRKRERVQPLPLATARFLPAAPPQQRRVWAWVDRWLLLLRCALLLALIAWLAEAVVAWRGDTVFVGPHVDPAWVDAQAQSAGMSQATRLRYCPAAASAGAGAANPPAITTAREAATATANANAGADPTGTAAAATALNDVAACDVQTPDILAWLTSHERHWRSEARLLVAGTGPDVPMPAQPPSLAHALALAVAAPASAASAVSAPFDDVPVVVASDRPDAWRALFTAYQSAGLARTRYRIASAPDAATQLIVWDRPSPPDPAWRAPLWWVADGRAFPALAAAPRLPGAPALRHTTEARGRLWLLEDPPLQDIDHARALFDTWRALQHAPLPYPAPTLQLAASTTAPRPVAIGDVQAPLAGLLALLFVLERALSHARRR